MASNKPPKPKPLLEFGKFLVNRKIVDEEAILDALNYQRNETIPIGKVALKEDMLTMKQVLEILNVQSNKTNETKRFGEIAVELGYLKEKDIDYLLELQIKLRSPIGVILVELKKISLITLEQELTRYCKYVEERAKS